MYPMKNLYKGFFCLSILLISLGVTAQKPPVREPDMNRPTLFQSLPEKITCRINILSEMLESETGRNVSISFTENTSLHGVVISVASANDNSVQSVVIRLSNFPGAALSFSRVLREDGTFSYNGRIISFQHGDAYEISEENGQFFFLKKGFYDLVNE